MAADSGYYLEITTSVSWYQTLHVLADDSDFVSLWEEFSDGLRGREGNCWHWHYTEHRPAMWSLLSFTSKSQISSHAFYIQS